MYNFWNSRIRLAYISCLLLLLRITLDQLRIYLENSERGQYQAENGNDDHGTVEGSFTDDMDYVLETMQYMYDLKLGKAEIRPVVEEVTF